MNSDEQHYLFPKSKKCMNKKKTLNVNNSYLNIHLAGNFVNENNLIYYSLTLR